MMKLSIYRNFAKSLFIAIFILSFSMISFAERTPEELIQALQNEDADVRYDAWSKAGHQPPAVIGKIARLITSDDPGIAKAAKGALENMVHSVGKSHDSERYRQVVDEMLKALDINSYEIRVEVLRNLSTIAEGDAVAEIAAWVGNPVYQEEVVFCLERIPGSEATAALIAALKTASDDFKPRVMAALGHRQDEEATELLGEYMKSPDSEIAIAAMKAIARIGRQASDAAPPAVDSLSRWQRFEYVDSMLRYVEAQIKRENTQVAENFYIHLLTGDLDYTEEHHKCAAIVGLAKIKSQRALEAIRGMRNDESYIVRITAEKALKGSDE